MRGKLEESIRRLGLIEHVRLVGQKLYEQMPTWHAAADVLLHTSQHEGFGNAVAEASSCARPVVASRVDAIPEVVLEGKSGLLVNHDDVDGFADALIKLLSNKSLSESMGNAGRSHLVKNFSWSAHTKIMLEMYRSVLKASCP